MGAGPSPESLPVTQPIKESHHFEIDFVRLLCRVPHCDHTDPPALLQAAQHEVDSAGLRARVPVGPGASGPPTRPAAPRPADHR
jgi:hypothetical protein